MSAGSGCLSLTVRLIRCATLIGTLSKINWLMAFCTDMFAVEFIGKYLFFRTTTRTFTHKRFQISKGFKPGAVTTWCIHSIHLQRLLVCFLQIRVDLGLDFHVSILSFF